MDAWKDLLARFSNPARALLELARFSRELRAIEDSREPWVRERVEGNDEICHYYRFLYEVARAIKPAVTVETGTRLGCSALQLAKGNPEGTVYTVDIDPGAAHQVASLKVENILAVTGDSEAVFETVKKAAGKVDLLYIDSEHSLTRVSLEYRLYGSLVRKGGLILFNDIAMNDEMRRFWTELGLPKVELNHLHTGFGFGAAINIWGA